MKSITLSGFQVFEEPATIPLERLTFLYGPNSSGKSAVEDGLVLLAKICESFEDETDLFDYVHKSVLPLDLIQKNWRRTAGNPVRIADRMVLSAESKIHNTFFEALGSDVRGTDHSTRLTFTFESTSEAPDWLEDFRWFRQEVLFHIEADVDGEPLVALEDSKSAQINLNNPALHNLQIDTVLPKIGEKLSIDALPEDDNGNAKSIGEIYRTDDGIFLSSNHVSTMSKSQRLILRWHVPGYKLSNSSEAAIDAFTKLYDRLLTTVIKYFPVASTKIIGASRTVPKPEELVYQFIAEEKKFGLRSEFYPEKNGVPEIRPLALSFVVRDVMGWDELYEDEEMRELADNVNKSLIDDLFSERGYRVTYDYRKLVSPKDELEGVLIRLMLSDSEGRNYNFNEVGSGLGYVLPVLVGLWDEYSVESNWARAVVLQQPELHLHPALQASLGDVLIDASSKVHRDSVIIETHSEHMLLRVLKRIRQTTQGTIGSEYCIAPEDVAVMYFEPDTSGKTKVKRIRIANDGDFLDRWPKGFFAERDQELFDE